jgi:hypothetical protein
MSSYYCKKCWHLYDGQGEPPAVCITCHSDTKWTTFFDPPEFPTMPWVWTEADQKLVNLHELLMRVKQDYERHKPKS